jgi:hypothetical protein
MDSTTSPNAAYINCACVIHSDGYDWQYVDKLYNMLSKNFTRPVKLHVYTENDRVVPDHMVKHVLQEWPGVAGPKKSWWYKMQLFNPQLFDGHLLYFDLDVVITGNLDWIETLSQRNFWAIHDFRRLWKKSTRTINSSMMYFDTKTYSYVWDKFQQLSLTAAMAQYQGDQDFITEAVNPSHLRYFDLDRIISWRWQALDRGPKNRRPWNKLIQSETKIPETTSVLVFHGEPKPHEIQDPVIQYYWS